MRHCVCILVLMISWLAVTGNAQAETLVKVVTTDPAGDVVSLARDEPFYVRIEYDTDAPVSIWVKPCFHGKVVQHAKTNPSITHAGVGYALGWFSLDGASEVDEIRIRAGGGKPYREWDAASYPVKVTGTGLPATARKTADWVDTLSREEKAVRQQAYEKAMNTPMTTTERLFGIGFMLVVGGLLFGGVLVPAWAVWRWRGGWRIAAAVPATLMAFVILRILVGTALDPTSHNLWPFEILMFGTVSLAIVVGLMIVRRFVRTED